MKKPTKIGISVAIVILLIVASIAVIKIASLGKKYKKATVPVDHTLLALQEPTLNEKIKAFWNDFKTGLRLVLDRNKDKSFFTPVDYDYNPNDAISVFLKEHGYTKTYDDVKDEISEIIICNGFDKNDVYTIFPDGRIHSRIHDETQTRDMADIKKFFATATKVESEGSGGIAIEGIAYIHISYTKSYPVIVTWKAEDYPQGEAAIALLNQFSELY